MKKLAAIAVMAAVTTTIGLMGCSSGEGAAKEVSKESSDKAAKDEGNESADGLKIGLAVQTLSNQVWAQQAEQITTRAKADNHEITVVECKENANTQIAQIENFISAGTDIIIVQPQDPEAIEEVCAEARQEGIKVISWDEQMENSDVNWIIDNYDLGVEIGTQAANWINEKFGDEGCEVAVLGYPQTPILLERENGILDALKEKAPKATVVANQPAIDTTEGLNAMETILQSNPDVKVVCCIGGGGAAGANEAFKGFYGSEVPNQVGIFSTDLTDEAIAAMENDEFNRVVIAITGNAYACGDTVYDLAIECKEGTLTEQNIYRELIPVTKENLGEMVPKK